MRRQRTRRIKSVRTAQFEASENLRRVVLSPFEPGLVAVVRNNIIPLVGRGAGDKGHDGFGVAHVEDFMRHARFDVNKIAGFVLQDLLEPGSEFVAHFSFEDIKNHLEADMNMGIRDATWRYRGYVG